MRALRRIRQRWLAASSEPERGDVPGWVMITLMTAGLVVMIWALAGDMLAQIFQTAMDQIMGGP